MPRRERDRGLTTKEICTSNPSSATCSTEWLREDRGGVGILLQHPQLRSTTLGTQASTQAIEHHHFRPEQGNSNLGGEGAIAEARRGRKGATRKQTTRKLAEITDHSVCRRSQTMHRRSCTATICPSPPARRIPAQRWLQAETKTNSRRTKRFDRAETGVDHKGGSLTNTKTRSPPRMHALLCTSSDSWYCTDRGGEKSYCKVLKFRGGFGSKKSRRLVSSRLVLPRLLPP